MSKGGSQQAQQPVDPASLGPAQTATNIATAQTQAGLNNVNTISPFGSSLYTPFTDANGNTRYSLNQQLSPELQALFGRQTGLAGDITGAAGTALGGGGTIGDIGLALTRQGAGYAGNVQPTADFGAVPNIPVLTPGSFATNVTTGAGGQALTPVQTGVGSNLPIQAEVAGGGPVQSTVSTDFGDLTRQAQDAAYRQQTQYLDPQFRQGRQQITQQLADQGLQPGTEAYDRALGDFDRQQQMAYQSAQSASVQAGNEQQRALFGEALGAGQFANQAQQQRFGQGVTQGQFANTAQAQDFAQRVASGEFGNQAQQQMFGQGFQLANLYNQAVLGAAGQNAQAQAGNLQRAQAQFQDPLAALTTVLGAGTGAYGAGLGSIGAALPAVGAAPTWPISIPTMGGAPATVAPTNLGALTNAATQQNQLANLASRQQFGDIGSLGGSLLTGGGLGSALFGQGGALGAAGLGQSGLFGSLFGPTAADTASSNALFNIFAAAGTPVGV